MHKLQEYLVTKKINMNKNTVHLEKIFLFIQKNMDYELWN